MEKKATLSIIDTRNFINLYKKILQEIYIYIDKTLPRIQEYKLQIE